MLTREDKLLRNLCGWRCECCAARGADDVGGGGRLVGGDGLEEGTVSWTHFEGGVGKSRLDVGVEVGTTGHLWELKREFRPEWANSTRNGEVGPLSDHSMVSWSPSGGGCWNGTWHTTA